MDAHLEVTISGYESFTVLILDSHIVLQRGSVGRHLVHEFCRCDDVNERMWLAPGRRRKQRDGGCHVWVPHFAT